MTESSQAGDRPPTWLSVLLRLCILRPVKLAPSGNATHATLIMGAMWLALWIAVDRWQSGPGPQFSPGGIPLLAWYALAVLGLAALMQWRANAATFGPVLALAMGAVPVPLLFLGVAAVDVDSRWFLGAALAAGIYVLLYLGRGLRAITGEPQRAAALAGLVFIAGFCWLSDALDAIPDVWTPREAQTAEPGGVAADGEALLFGQSGRIDEALEAVQRAKSPKSQAFFLGFAGVGDQKVFAQEVGLASRVLGERYDIGERRVALINDERDLESAPLATVSGLKYALRGLASRMNVDQDVLFLSISSHGAQDPAIAVSNSQLTLNDLTDEDLADALRESGIKWRVIIISACYAGGFIERLRDPQTIVITAAAADRTSFGCSNDRDLTYFGEAFYRDALPSAPSLRDAFDTAKAAIGAREKREHVDASNPQAYFGKAIAEKLIPLESHQ
jgi:Peptidase C13 family